MGQKRDHGGGIDAAIRQYGGQRSEWIDLSTGINPVPYPMPTLPDDAWTALPDQAAFNGLIDAARAFWNVPEGAAILPVPGCSSAIAMLPHVLGQHRVDIPGPTYNEHAAAFQHAGYDMDENAPDLRVIVHPNNPTGHFHALPGDDLPLIIDESFCDISPTQSMIATAADPGRIILKSFGKFWGLAGLRLGFVVGAADVIEMLQHRIGPWQVSGPALAIGAAALNDLEWARATRARLETDAARLDAIVQTTGAKPMGEVSLFRTYQTDHAAELHQNLCRAKILTRVFPYAENWIRFGLPGPDGWARLEAAI